MKTKKINLYKYTLQRKNDVYGRKRLRGVFHTGGYQIASDGRLMCRIKADYPAELEGKIVDKKGQIISEKYEDWLTAIHSTTGSKLLKIDLELLMERTQKGLERIKPDNKPVLAAIKGPDKDAYFEIKEFARFLDFISFYPDCKIYYKEFFSPLKAVNRNGDLCLIMPVNITSYPKDCTIVDYPLENAPMPPETTVEKSEKFSDTMPVSPKTDGGDKKQP